MEVCKLSSRTAYKGETGMNKKRALRLAREWAQGHACSIRDGEAKEYHAMFASMLEESMPNEPLTIEQLREMDGEPVWVETKAGLKFWGIVTKICVSSGDGRYLLITEDTEYGQTWVAYRHPPEGEEDT